MNNYLRYYDERFGDVYEIYTDHDCNFITACRSLEAFGRNSIYYDDIEQIPLHVKAKIEQLLVERKSIK